MLAVYIICAVIIVIILLLLMPIKLKVLIDKNFTYKVSVGPVSILHDKPLKAKKTQKTKDIGKRENENYLAKLYRERGFSGTVAELFSYLKIIFSELGYFLGKIKIRDFICNVRVSDDDAAETAISYGIVSAAVYGFTGFLNNVTDFKYKSITVNADYSSDSGSFELGFTVKSKVIYLLMTALKLIIKFVNYKREV